MHLGFATGNVLQKFVPSVYNIIYYPQNNLFDYLITALEYNYYILGDNTTGIDLPNTIDLPNDRISLYNYNVSITNNIIGYTTNNIKHFHINSLIFTHSNKPVNIKKEDSLLMSQRLPREHKIFFTETARNSWRLENNVHVYKYGIPDNFSIQKNIKERKEILILNTENTQYAKHIYKILSQAGINTDIIARFPADIAGINSLFNEYKICIDLAEHNIINLLCAIASGCKGLTLKQSSVPDEYSSVNGLVFINSIDDLLKTVTRVLSQIENDNDNSNDIKQQFSFEQFRQNTNEIIHKANNEAFIL